MDVSSPARLAHLQLPFFDDGHRALAAELDAWSALHLQAVDHHDTDASCRALVRALGSAGFLRHCVPATFGGASTALDSRALVVCRETLARHDGLADFAFAMQGLGSGPITLAGPPALQAEWLPRVARGECITAFALSEPEAGSDVAAMACSARDEGDHVVLNGEKTWISNGGIADIYCVFARDLPAAGTGEAAALRGTKGLSAYLVHAGTPGLQIAERIEVIAPHPLARLRFTECRVPKAQRLGAAGEGFKLAMRTLDIFRASVAAAALGFARRALDEALQHAQQRRMFDQRLADFQLSQAAFGDMAAAIDAAALLTYRAAWLRDSGQARTTREAAMAKMVATENAQQVIDRALQMHGGLGVRVGSVVEGLYREIRALRIYEGATEVQRLIIGRDLLAG
ncbi:acyl-CoA dehydrogenase family protein [Rubrivivax rivuli]|uniref:Acyl-CoA dehydrogenase n=1 Tax=Rubrivivax rivuli TaxID=1862385 RepID=A0A437REG2_9BURK|nr:acyl-CoA dehydrogenase family protein [Rubrivivax rivuli]RVU45139.1 acyl-CoA dehydrogenase [Rubrivivax rivuli]